MEHSYTAHFTVTPLHADCFGRCKPSGLLRFAQDAAEAHCLRLGADWDTMAKKNYFWAVIRQRIEITRLPETGETVTVKTWPMPTTRVAYPRATEGFDEAGNSLFKVISIWVIMDMQSRTMVLPVKSGVVVDGISFGTELKAPGGLPLCAPEQENLRTVSFSDLDINGHMNNTRYLDWICDLLPAAYHKDHPLKAVTICYMSEALEGQQLHLSISNGDVFHVDGSVEATDVSSGHTRIFSARAEF